MRSNHMIWRDFLSLERFRSSEKRANEPVPREWTSRECEKNALQTPRSGGLLVILKCFERSGCCFACRNTGQTGILAESQPKGAL